MGSHNAAGILPSAGRSPVNASTHGGLSNTSSSGKASNLLLVRPPRIVTIHSRALESRRATTTTCPWQCIHTYPPGPHGATAILPELSLILTQVADQTSLLSRLVSPGLPWTALDRPALTWPAPACVSPALDCPCYAVVTYPIPLACT